MRRVIITGLIGLTTAGAAFAADEGIKISPSIGVSESYTDNSAGGQKGQPDLVEPDQPGLEHQRGDARIKINFTYTPTFNHFDLGNSPDRVDQNLNGAGYDHAVR